MRVVLRHSKTKFFYAKRGRWVRNPSAAAQFERVDEALLLNRQEHLHETEIVILHSDGEHTKVLPIGNGSWVSRQWMLAGQTGAVEAPPPLARATERLIPPAPAVGRRRVLLSRSR